MKSFFKFIQWISLIVFACILILILSDSKDSEKVSQVSKSKTISKPQINQELINLINEINHDISDYDEVRRPSSREMQSRVDAMKAKREGIFGKFKDAHCPWACEFLNPVPMKIQCTMGLRDRPRNECSTKIKVGKRKGYVVIKSIEPAKEYGWTWGSPLGTLPANRLNPEKHGKIGKTYPGDTVVIENAIVTNVYLDNGFGIFGQNVNTVYIDYEKENVKIIPPK